MSDTNDGPHESRRWVCGLVYGVILNILVLAAVWSNRHVLGDLQSGSDPAPWDSAEFASAAALHSSCSSPTNSSGWNPTLSRKKCHAAWDPSGARRARERRCLQEAATSASPRGNTSSEESQAEVRAGTQAAESTGGSATSEAVTGSDVVSVGTGSGTVLGRFSLLRRSMREGSGNDAPATSAAEKHTFLTRQELQRKARSIAKEGIVIMVACNLGYFDFFANWAAFAKEVGLERHFLAFVEDEESYEFVERRWPGQAVRYHVGELENAAAGVLEDVAVSQGHSGGNATDYDSEGFKLLMYRRLFYLRTLLSSGLHVLLCDVDTIFLKDPFPYFGGGFDVYGVVEVPDPWMFNATGTFLRTPPGSTFLCGGFLLFRNTAYASLVTDHIILSVFRTPKPRARHYNDQNYLNFTLDALARNHQYWLAPRIGVLPQQSFPPGFLFFRNATWRGRNWGRVVWVHNNWLIGKSNKLLRYRELGLWRVPEPRADKYCAQAHSCSQDGELAASPRAPKAQTWDQPGAGRAVRLHDAAYRRIDTMRLSDDAQRAIAVLRERAGTGGGWGGRSFVIFCIPVEGEESLLRNWVASLSAAGLGDHFVLFATTEALHAALEKAYPGHSILLSRAIRIPNVAPRRWGSSLLRLLFGSGAAQAARNPPAPPFLQLVLQPFLLRAILNTLDDNSTVVYSEVDSVFLKDPMPFLPSSCSVLVANEPPDVIRPHWDDRWGFCLPLTSPSMLHSASTKLFAVRADELGRLLSLHWSLLVARDWPRWVTSGTPAADAAAGLMRLFPDAVRWLVSLMGPRGGRPRAPGGVQEPPAACHVAALPPQHFPPDYLVFGPNSLWLRAHAGEVVTVRNDAGRNPEDLESAYHQAGIWSS